jgi:hypothetical protein
VTGKDGVDDLRNDRIFVADDAGKQIAAGLEASHQVGAQLILHRAPRQFGFGEFTPAQCA